MKTKIIQLTTAVHFNKNVIIYALCEDGSVWVRRHGDIYWTNLDDSSQSKTKVNR
jgi:hypothetical protein